MRAAAGLLACALAAPLPALADNVPPPDPARVTDPWSYSYDLMVRGSFTDIPLFPKSKADSRFEAEGAQFSFAMNRLNGQTGLSVDGLGAAVLRAQKSDIIVTGVYVQGDGTYNFDTATLPSKRSDSVTYGAFVQAGFDSPIFAGVQDYVRLRAGYNDGSLGTTSISAVGEWAPYFHALRPRELGDSGLMLSPTPELMVEYDHFNDGSRSARLFQVHDDALRIGPQINVKLFLRSDQGHAACDPAHPFADVLHCWSASLTYHVADDTYTGRGYYATQEVLNYNLTSADGVTFGLSAGYTYGNSETSGNPSSQFKIGLSVKH